MTTLSIIIENRKSKIDVAYVACGHFDGFREEGLNRWNINSSVLLIDEVGGHVSYYADAKFST